MRRFRIVVAVLGYVTIFLWAYATILAREFSYEGFRLDWPDPGIMALLIALILLPAFLLPYSLTRPSGLIVWWLYLAAYIPSILVPVLNRSTPVLTLLPLQVTLLLSMGLLCLVCSARVLAIGRITLSPGLFWPAFGLVWLTGLAYSCMYGHTNVLANLSSIFAGATEYDIRREYVAERGPALSYAVGQLGQALNPFLIAFGIAYRRRTCLLAGIAGQIIIFGVTGFKTVLFSAIFLPMVLIFMRRSQRNFGVAFTSGLIAIILLCAVADRATGNIFSSSLITRRTLAAPGLLTGFYFDHFSQVSHAGIAYHLPGNGGGMSISQEIGLVYFGSTEVDANANLWAQGFADLGLPGMLGFTFFMALMIWMYDSVAAQRNLELAVLLAAMPAVAFSNGAPTTVLITHGGLAVALLLCLAPVPPPIEEPAGANGFEENQLAPPMRAFV